MAVRVVTEDAPIIRITGTASAPVSSSIAPVRTVNVSSETNVVKVPSAPSPTVEVDSIASAEVKVSNPIVRPFKAVIFQGPRGEPGDSSQGSSVLTSDFTATNTVGEVESGDTFFASTNLEIIIRQMLSDDDAQFSILSAIFENPSTGVVYPGNKFEIGSPLALKSLFVELKNASSMFPGTGSTITGSITSPTVSDAYIVLSPPLLQPNSSGGWSDFPEFTTWSVGHSPASLNYTALGEKKVRALYLTLTNPNDSSYLESRESFFSFFIGKKIRCFTSVAKNPRATNLGGVGAGANVYGENETLLSTVFGQDLNELQFEDVIVDFSSDSQEVIVSFSGATQSVSDKSKYLVIEIPDEFVIDESAATTAGSGVYSLNDSIVYLGNQSEDGTPYTRNSIPIKYYRSRIPGAFNDKIKLDLQIKLDN